MFVARISHVMGFVDDGGEEMFPENSTGERLFRLRNIPRTGVLLLRLTMCLLEVVEEGLHERISSVSLGREKATYRLTRNNNAIVGFLL